jgi:hypothetical protein
LPTAAPALAENLRRKRKDRVGRSWYIDECWRCHSAGNDVHHASYHPLVMAGLADEWLFTLCRIRRRWATGTANL